MVALNAIVNVKYNKSFACNLWGMRFVFFFFLLASALCWSCVWFRLLLFVLVVSYFLFWLVQLLSLGSLELFFPGIILDICKLILSLLGIHVVMQCNDAIIWVLASLPLLPFRGNQVQGTPILEKKICVRDNSRSKVPLLLSRMLPVDH